MDHPHLAEDADVPSLLAAARAGDTDAFAAIYASHVGMVAGIARRWAHERHLAEDLAQEAFARLLAGSADLRDHSEVRRWLARVTRNLAISSARRARHASWMRPAELAPIAGGADPTRLVDVRLTVATLLAELRDSDAQLIVEHYIHELSLAEMADHRHTSRDVVKVQLHRARQRARKTARDRDIDPLPWLPAPVAQLVGAIKAVTPHVIAKGVVGVLVPALVLGGIRLGVDPPHSAGTDGGSLRALLEPAAHTDQDPAASTVTDAHGGEDRTVAGTATVATQAPPPARAGVHRSAPTRGDPHAALPLPVADRTVRIYDSYQQPSGGNRSVRLAPVLGDRLGADVGVIEEDHDPPEQRTAVDAACAGIDAVPDDAAHCTGSPR